MINSDLIRTVQKRLDDVSSSASGVDYDTTSVINELQLAYNEVASQPAAKLYIFPTENTSLTVTANGSNGQDEYTLPTDHNFMIERVLYDSTATTPTNLRYVHPDELQSRRSELGAGVTYYSTRGNKLYLAGTPQSGDVGKTIKLWYATRPETIANDGVETILGKYCPHLLIHKAAGNLALSDDELVRVSDSFLAQYEKGLDRFISQLEDGGAAYGQYQINTFAE